MPVVNDVAGFPCYEVEFTKSGSVNDGADVDGTARFVIDRGITDLFVISHGWNNDMTDARELYARFFAKVRNILDGGQVEGLEGRAFGILAILWPSKKFAERQLIPSGAAGAVASISNAEIVSHLESLEGVFDKPGADQVLEEAKALVPSLADRASARREFADKIRSLVPSPDDDHGEAVRTFIQKDGNSIIEALQGPVVVLPPKGAKPGAAAGLISDALRGAGSAVGSGLRSVGGAIVDTGRSINDAVERFLNYTTYYQMKERAGSVGQGGVYQVLRHVRDEVKNVRLHLIGHSFGGRLVTAATLGPIEERPIMPDSLCLLQAAFSHNGFAKLYDGTHNGFFCRVVENKQVAGPVLVTYTANDQAVGMAYAYASRISGDTSSGVGDANDVYGGIGRNGAQHMNLEEAVFLELAPVGATYGFKPRMLHNVHSDVISEHNDICKSEVAYAVLTAVATT